MFGFQGMLGLLQSKFSGPDFKVGNPVGLKTLILTFILGVGLGIYFFTQSIQKRKFYFTLSGTFDLIVL